MVSNPIDDLEEPTTPCRYLLFTETPAGEISVRAPSCDSQDVEVPSNRVVLVQRPAEPVEPPPESESLRVSVVRSKS